MSLPTFGSTETILHLLASFQNVSGRGPDLWLIWSQITIYRKQGGEYNFYPLADYNPDKPAGEYVADLWKLVERRYVRSLPKGILEVTALGRCFASAKDIPESLLPLEKAIEEMAMAVDTSN